jgi:hypothetical protein
MNTHLAHDHATSTEAPFVDEGPRSDSPDALVLDIGGNVGALILVTTQSALGLEVEVSRRGERERTHTMIRRRRAEGRDVFAGVYPSLVAGDYVIWGRDDLPIGSVRIEGGRVAEFHAGPITPPR